MVDFAFSTYDLEYFLLILVRVSSFVLIAPFFSLNNTPVRVRLGLSIFISVLLYQTLTPAPAIQYSTVLGYAVIIVKEALTGFLIGFGTNMCVSKIGRAHV